MVNQTAQMRGIGVFSDQESLAEALQQLKANNFAMERISVIARDADDSQNVEGAEVSDEVGDQKVRSATGIVTDAVRSATWGSLLVGLSSLAIPGLGAIIAVGSVGTALLAGFAGTGLSLAEFNNMANAFMKLGVPETEARMYAEALSTGQNLVIVEGSDAEVQQAEAVFKNSQVQNWSTHPAQAIESR
nr:MAG: hypothetical protein EDM05_30165 [Leptolyngbya sp. IPPAS B-1204]